MNWFIKIYTTFLSMMFVAVTVVFFLEYPITASACFIFSFLVYAVSPWDRETIKIKYFDRSLAKVNKISKGDWIDLRASKRVELKKGECKLIPLGVGMILPKGYEAHLVARSSTPGKFGIMSANSIGIIDNSYSGDLDEWHFPAVALTDTVIEKGDRICQFRIVKNQPRIKFDIVSHLNEISRGGIGSTGKR